MHGFVLLAISFWIIELAVTFVRSASDFAYPDDTLTRFAFGSCHKSKYAKSGDDNIWTTIQTTTEPQLWVWTGDAVYPPSRGIAGLQELEEAYKDMKENPAIGYSSFYPPLGTFGTWDDHDFGGNDMGSGMPDKQDRANIFFQFLGQRRPEPRNGVYSSVLIGKPPNQVKIIMLDTRWHRDEYCIPSVATKLVLGAGISCFTRWLSAGVYPSWCNESSTVLGEEQWNWLEQQVDFPNNGEDPALTVVVSSVQVLTTNPTMEGWGHFPVERTRLVRLLASLANHTKVLILSGDVHHGEIMDPARHKEDSFLEITSSGLTHDCSKHIYGKLCKPILDTYTQHRFLSKEDNRSAKKKYV